MSSKARDRYSTLAQPGDTSDEDAAKHHIQLLTRRRVRRAESRVTAEKSSRTGDSVAGGTDRPEAHPKSSRSRSSSLGIGVRTVNPSLKFLVSEGKEELSDQGSVSTEFESGAEIDHDDSVLGTQTVVGVSLTSREDTRAEESEGEVTDIEDEGPNVFESELQSGGNRHPVTDQEATAFYQTQYAYEGRSPRGISSGFGASFESDERRRGICWETVPATNDGIPIWLDASPPSANDAKH